MGIETGTALLAGSLFGGGMSILSAKSQSKAAKNAAAAQERATDQAIGLQREMYYQNREDLAPWRKFGERNLLDLQRETGLLQDLIKHPRAGNDPAYNFLLGEGIKALNRGASSGGRLDSGESLKDLVSFGQGLASQDYGQAINRQNLLLNRLAGNAGVGQSAANTTAGFGQNYANTLSNLFMNQGNNQASSIINQANARTGMYQNFGNLASKGLNNYFFLNALKNPGGAAWRTYYT